MVCLKQLKNGFELCVGLKTPYSGIATPSEGIRLHPNVVCGLPTTYAGT
jgi:hypothetical protein